MSLADFFVSLIVSRYEYVVAKIMITPRLTTRYITSLVRQIREDKNAVENQIRWMDKCGDFELEDVEEYLEITLGECEDGFYRADSLRVA